MAQHVTVTTAVELTATQRKEVMQVAQAKAGTQEIELKEVVNPAVIGGIRLTIGSKQYDATVLNQLETLRNLA
ncbi:F0F1 ATP synthase subunit delta [Candidatus Woesebacteria bacterium]|nr:F0F1 ATP synthase subunit delta [Candidatus Woesebacteria bacterium]MCD8506799.1 F0F1 ATP synthase subunit delta [Candidatus Woesebacteria bacterium]MCD8527708.1 F0F1 ATP synthase subunit delta [Candidatus Woesebacteria bacterium]MCD8546323.1 F0F1 ATP synthase subunit delta [Candidatus Woesebacteria bacterium]